MVVIFFVLSFFAKNKKNLLFLRKNKKKPKNIFILIFQLLHTDFKCNFQFKTMNGKTLRLLTSAKLLISFRTHLHSLKYLSSNNSNDGSNSFLNVDLEWQHFYKLFLHLKLINFIPLMTSMLLFLKNASLKIMNTVIFGSFHPFWR